LKLNTINDQAFNRFMRNIVLTFWLSISFSLFGQDWPDLNRYRDDNARLGLPAANETRVVFMGNSITEGWSNFLPEYFSAKSYINRGISGQTTPQMLVRFRADVIDLQPKAVVILAGTNDIAGNTGPATIKMIADNIISMAELARENNILVVISSVLPVYDYSWKPGLEPVPKISKLNEIIKNYAIKHGHTYLDYYAAMVDDRKGLHEEYTSDGVHPNKAGYEVMATLAEQAIANTLDYGEIKR